MLLFMYMYKGIGIINSVIFPGLLPSFRITFQL